MKSLCVPLFILMLIPSLHAEDAFPLRDGDRVVLIGSTVIEREQRYGYWETRMTSLWPERNITFRNLGWSGDTVWGESRAGFDAPAQGYKRLIDHTLALKPTVIIVGYGTNESFEGSQGLRRFVEGLETLLDAFAPTKARIVLISPLRQENLGPPLPDPTENNKNLSAYTDAIRDVAIKRGHVFVDLYNFIDAWKLFGERSYPLTDNGIHLTAHGYWRTANAIEWSFDLPTEDRFIKLNSKGDVLRVKGVRARKVAENPERLEVTLNVLPEPPPPKEGAPTNLRQLGSRIGVTGRRPLNFVHDLAQAEELRQAIVAKNRLYFYRWRPENETYLFGFRKHEQGQNAREIPQFDPLIAEKEKEIAKLRTPVPHTYELIIEKKP